MIVRKKDGNGFQLVSSITKTRICAWADAGFLSKGVSFQLGIYNVGSICLPNLNNRKFKRVGRVVGLDCVGLQVLAAGPVEYRFFGLMKGNLLVCSES